MQFELADVTKQAVLTFLQCGCHLICIGGLITGNSNSSTLYKANTGASHVDVCSETSSSAWTSFIEALCEGSCSLVAAWLPPLPDSEGSRERNCLMLLKFIFQGYQTAKHARQAELNL